MCSGTGTRSCYPFDLKTTIRFPGLKVEYSKNNRKFWRKWSKPTKLASLVKLRNNCIIHKNMNNARFAPIYFLSSGAGCYMNFPN
ncbi:MAG: chitobiase/beta-hexosaminidase C-terminal domain-containing protein [Fidelibacterota bacterium]